MYFKDMVDLKSLPFQATYIKVFSNREAIRTCFHILLKEDFATGRFKRSAGDSLCRRQDGIDELGRPLPLFYEMELVNNPDVFGEVCLKCAKKSHQYSV